VLVCPRVVLIRVDLRFLLSFSFSFSFSCLSLNLNLNLLSYYIIFNFIFLRAEKQSKAKQSKAKQSKAKQSKAKQSKWLSACCVVRVLSCPHDVRVMSACFFSRVDFCVWILRVNFRVSFCPRIILSAFDLIWFDLI
jgi:hypothetical protein